MVFRASGSFQDAVVHGQGTSLPSQPFAERVLLVWGSGSGLGSVEDDAEADRFPRILVEKLSARRREDPISTFDLVSGGCRCRCRCRPVVSAGAGGSAGAGLEEVALLAVGVRDIDRRGTGPGSPSRRRPIPSLNSSPPAWRTILKDNVFSRLQTM